MSALFPSHEESLENIIRGRADVQKLRDEAHARLVREQVSIEAYDDLLRRMDDRMRALRSIVAPNA